MISRRSTLFGFGSSALISLVPRVGRGESGEKSSSGEVAAVSREVAQRWFGLALTLTKNTSGFTPPVASRAFGYLGFTLYQSVVEGMPGFPDLSRRVTGKPAIHKVKNNPNDKIVWASVANAAMAGVCRALYGDKTVQAAANLAAIATLESQLVAVIGASAKDQAKSSTLGAKVADDVAKYASTDGGHRGYLSNFPTSYVPPVGPGLWKPTPSAFQRALQPYWGNNRLFSLSSAASVDPGPPPAFSLQPGSAFRAELDQVYNTVYQLPSHPDWLTIAEFWSDDPGTTATPPGHSISIASIVLEQTNANLAVAAETYAKVGMAIADAFVAGWRTKYTYNLVRPITLVYENLGDTQWPLPLSTPPFPEYISGHSVQSGAAAAVLTDVFGALAFDDTTHVNRGFAVRHFDNFYAFADEAAISRLYGGIHFYSAINNGLVQGNLVADAVLDLFV